MSEPNIGCEHGTDDNGAFTELTFVKGGLWCHLCRVTFRPENASEAAALRAERDRYREALEKVGCIDSHGQVPGDCVDVTPDNLCVVCRALAETKENGT